MDTRITRYFDIKYWWDIINQNFKKNDRKKSNMYVGAVLLNKLIFMSMILISLKEYLFYLISSKTYFISIFKN